MPQEKKEEVSATGFGPTHRLTSGSAGLARGSVSPGERSLAPDLARGFMLLLIAMAYAPVYLFNVEPGVYTHPAGGDLSTRESRGGRDQRGGGCRRCHEFPRQRGALPVRRRRGHAASGQHAGAGQRVSSR
jgi:hypothetical protein